MSIPNMISLVRILLTPLFVRFYLEGKDWAALYVLCAAAASDVLDGAIARRFNMITPLGKVLDPVADKLLQLAMLLESYMISFEHIDNTFVFCEGGAEENTPDCCGNLYAVKVD